MTSRLFVALEVPAPARQVLDAAVAPLRGRHDALRWVPPVDWHVTLAFLGPTPVARQLRVRHALEEVARRAPAIPLTVDGRLGRFGDRVLWAGVTSADDVLAPLATAVRAAVPTVDVSTDGREFRAHLTLARAPRGHPVPRAVAPLVATGLPVRWTVRRLALMASHRRGGAGRYRAVATWPLGAGPAAGAPA